MPKKPTQFIQIGDHDLSESGLYLGVRVKYWSSLTQYDLDHAKVFNELIGWDNKEDFLEETQDMTPAELVEYVKGLTTVTPLGTEVDWNAKMTEDTHRFHWLFIPGPKERDYSPYNFMYIKFATQLI